jgi:hypothetical protein
VRNLAIVAGAVAFGLVPAFLAQRKARSCWWWWLAGLVAWLPSLVLVLDLPRPGEQHEFRAPLALLIFALCLLSLFGALAVASQLF